MVLARDVVVGAPAEEVFDFLADARNEERWNPNVIHIDLLSTGAPGPGSRFAGRYRRGGRMAFEITGYERPSRLVFRGGGRQLRFVATVRVTAAGDRTAVAMRADMRPRGPLKLLGPLARPVMERSYADVVERFRAVVEDGRA